MGPIQAVSGHGNIIDPAQRPTAADSYAIKGDGKLLPGRITGFRFLVWQPRNGDWYFDDIALTSQLVCPKRAPERGAVCSSRVDTRKVSGVIRSGWKGMFALCRRWSKTLNLRILRSAGDIAVGQLPEEGKYEFRDIIAEWKLPAVPLGPGSMITFCLTPTWLLVGQRNYGIYSTGGTIRTAYSTARDYAKWDRLIEDTVKDLRRTAPPISSWETNRDNQGFYLAGYSR